MPGACCSSASASPGCARLLKAGQPRTCRVTGAKAPGTSRRRSARWRGCRKACAAGLTTETSRPLWAGPTSRTSSRLGYLESAGTISRYHRNVICRGARTVLAGIRALGLARPGQAAAGLHGDFAVGAGDIPATPVRGEPGRDLPPEIMTILCASLDTLQPPEVRAATEIAIDTGRRPEDILGLPLDCLAHDKDGTAVLVYDNAKADRIGRRLPVSQATATVIIGQQDRVRAQFPGTPPAELKLLPAARCNPDGRKPMTIDMFEGRHREWADSLGPLRARNGVAVDPAKITPYAYRHSTPKGTPTPECRSTCSPSCSITGT